MRKKTLPVLLLTLLLLLAGCSAPHFGQQEESGKDTVSLSGKEPTVTLKPRESVAPTASPTLVPTPTAAPAATPSPDPTPEVQESPLPTESAQETPAPSEQAKPEGNGLVCYLTFDDGPSRNTEAILEVLTEKGVTATFFVVGENAQEHPDRVKAIAEQGSLVANHTQTHKTDEIYKSAEACVKAFDDGRDTIISLLGEDYPHDLVRFPYGSTNRRCRDYRDAVKKAGYRYFDWNALNGDAESGAAKRTAEDLYEELKETVDTQYKKGRDVIVLMHDTNSKTNTVKMLPDAIDYIASLGYTFDTLENKAMN